MARRLHQTLVDYVVIAISPALIMALAGSLVFFLLGVFYQGEFQERLHWVMACFVLGAVLISRISIEEGFERAAPFGALMAILVGVAANQFMEFHGTWIDDYSWIINFTLIGVVWWCAHKLTWDCTVIDDADDASGEGLMQVVGLERPADPRNADADPHALEGTTSREVPAGFWRRYVERQRRPHAPGVWVVYFSLAALPIFGLGQWLIPAADTAARQHAFQLLCVYVAAGLGLLLTTSFLGLRRYLRQRRIEMPTLMANVWLSAGAAIIVVLLVVAMLLPRPSAEYAISELPVSLGSPERDSSDVAPLKQNGTEDREPGQAAAALDTDRDADAPPPTGAGNQSGGQANREGAGTTDSAQSSGSGSGGQQSGAGNQSGGQSSGGQASGGQASDESSGNQSSGNQSSAEQSGGDAGAKSSSASGDATSIERQGGQQSGPQPSQASRAGGDRPSQSSQRAEQQSGPQTAPGESQQGPSPAADNKPQQQQDKQGEENKESQFVQAVKRYRQQQREINEEYGIKSPQDSGDETSPEEESPEESQPSLPEIDPALSPLMMIVKWGFYLAFALAVLYALWRYRHDVLAAVRNFLAELRAWWAGLWGRRDYGHAAAETIAVHAAATPFAAYTDPFASGMAGRYSVEELVRYSFEAFEAWSREHGCERGPDETPYELARDVARLNAHIAADAGNLAELYSRAAYGRGGLTEEAREQMRPLWRQMTRRPLAAAP